jgi:hypothetical protein
VSFAAEFFCGYLARPALSHLPHVYGQRWVMSYAVFYALLGGAALVDPRFAVMILARSLLSASAAAGRLWLPRALGARSYAELLAQAARHGARASALLGVGASTGLLAALGGLVCWLSGDWRRDPEFWIGLGVIVYSLQAFGGGWKLYVRLFAASATVPSGPDAAPDR